MTGAIRPQVPTIAPPDRSSSKTTDSRHARLLSEDELAPWRVSTDDLLALYGLELHSVEVLRTRGDAWPPGGDLEGALLPGLVMSVSLGVLAVAAGGRGDLLDLAEARRTDRKKHQKENNDRVATAAIAESLYDLVGRVDEGLLEIAIGEGVRLKPGEAGGNPTLFGGQKIAHPSLRAFAADEWQQRASRHYRIAVDTVEGTGKSTLGLPSSGSLLYITESPVVPIPDLYFAKLQLHDVDSVDVDSPLKDMARELAERHGPDLNVFALDRDRHPLQAMADLGLVVRTDQDGDAYPALAAGLARTVYPDNQQPLHGIAGDIGGAAEMLASAAGASYLGVHSTARFASRETRSWSSRYDLLDEDLADIRDAHLEPEKIYTTRDLVPEIDTADGLFLMAGITDNWHIPGVRAAYVGGNFARVSALSVGRSGRAVEYQITFRYRQDHASTVRALDSHINRLRDLPPTEIPEAVKTLSGDETAARRLRTEFEISFYPLFDAEGHRFRLREDARGGQSDEHDRAIIESVHREMPDWFV